MTNIPSVSDWPMVISNIIHKETERIVAEEMKLAAKRVEDRVKELAPMVVSRISQQAGSYFGHPTVDICVKFWEAGEKTNG